jgi:hypothetical protein
MKINKILTESAKKAFIDQSGSLIKLKDKLTAKAKTEGHTDIYYFDDLKCAEPIKAAERGDNVVVYTDEDYKVNCPELAEIKNIEIRNIAEIKNESLTEAEAPEVEGTVEDEDLIIDDVLSTSVDEIADIVQTAKEEGTDGEETYSDANAKKVATEIKTAANGFNTAAWAPLDVPSELTDKLDDCLANAMVGHHVGTHDGVDLLIDGLPGSGKTGIVKQWATDRDVKLFYLNAKDDDLGANLNGFPVSVTEKDADGNEVHKVTRAFSKALDPLERPKSVLFLDEFNRAAPKLRAVLLTLINEHAISGDGDDGFRHFDNLLFTVACINPSVPTDPGAMDLNDAEMSRYVDTLEWDSKPSEAIKYITFYVNKLINNLDPKDENYNFLYVRYKKIFNLATALINDYRFEFDSRDDLMDLFNDKAKMLNQRSITDALMAHGYSKQKFLTWVDKYSKFLAKDKEMIHEILDSWVEPEVKVPTTASGSDSAVTGEIKNTSNAASAETFDSVFGTDGEETDNDLFGNTASVAGTAAKVSATDALNRIQNFDFTL